MKKQAELFLVRLTDVMPVGRRIGQEVKSAHRTDAIDDDTDSIFFGGLSQSIIQPLSMLVQLGPVVAVDQVLQRRQSGSHRRGLPDNVPA